MSSSRHPRWPAGRTFPAPSSGMIVMWLAIYSQPVYCLWLAVSGSASLCSDSSMPDMSSTYLFIISYVWVHKWAYLVMYPVYKVYCYCDFILNVFVFIIGVLCWQLSWNHLSLALIELAVYVCICINVFWVATVRGHFVCLGIMAVDITL